MTTVRQERVAPAHDLPARSGRAEAVAGRSGRPRWLMPALVVGGIAAALVASGLASPTPLVYAGLLAGCGLMHLFGHRGHGGHRSGGSADHPADA